MLIAPIDALLKLGVRSTTASADWPSIGAWSFSLSPVAMAVLNPLVRFELRRPAATRQSNEGLPHRCWPHRAGKALLLFLAALLTLLILRQAAWGFPRVLLRRRLLDGSNLFMLQSSSATPNTLGLLRQLQRDLGANRVVLVFDDTHAAWKLTPTQRITEPRRHSSPSVLLFNQKEADVLSGSLAGKGDMDHFGLPVLPLLLRHLNGSVPFQHLWRIEVRLFHRLFKSIWLTQMRTP